MLDLEAARERCRQATVGPWAPSPEAGDAVIAPEADPGKTAEVSLKYYGGPVVGESMHPADREFVIHARTDLPAALDELEAARRVVAEAEQAAEWLGRPESYNLEETIKDYKKVIGRTDG